MRPALLLALVACGASGTGATAPDPTAGIAPAGSDAGQVEPGPTPEEEAQIVALSQMANATAAPVRECVARAAADDFRVEGELTVAIRFGAIGTEPQVTALKDTVGDAVLTDCVSALVAGYGWPRDVFEAGSTLELPLHFTAPSAQYTVDLRHVPERHLAGGELMVQVALDAENTGDPAAAVSFMSISADTEVPIHRHPEAEEILFILGGNGQLWGLEGESKARAVGDGWLLRFPAGTAHAYRTTSGNLAMQIYAPAGPEQRFEGKDVPGGTVPVPAAELKKPARSAPRPIAVDVFGSAEGKALQAPELSQVPAAGFAAQPVYVGYITTTDELEVDTHVHEDGFEVVAIRGGAAVVTIDGEEHRVEADHVVKIPAGVPHSWRVLGGLNAVQIFVATERQP